MLQLPEADDLFRSRLDDQIDLKHANNLSDEDTCWRWLESPYWQYFTGELYFQTIATARVMKAVSARDLNRVIIDSTVQEKAIAPDGKHPAYPEVAP